jgi:hypothetical protein
MLTLHSRQIDVPRQKLLEALKKNEAIHYREYQEAMGNYYIALNDQLIAAVNKLQELNFTDHDAIRRIRVDFDAPVSHAEDYRKAIQMLEFSHSEHITVDESAFEAYVNNNWPWQQNFFANSSKYKGLAASAAVK